MTVIYRDTCKCVWIAMQVPNSSTDRQKHDACGSSLSAASVFGSWLIMSCSVAHMHFSLYFNVFSAVVNQRRIPHCHCQIGKIKHCALDRVGEAGLPFLKCTKIHVLTHQLNKLLKSCSKHILKKLFFKLEVKLLTSLLLQFRFLWVQCLSLMT